LRRLGLANNGIDNAGICALAGAAEAGATPDLQELSLHHNGIKEAGVGALMSALNSQVSPAQAQPEHQRPRAGQAATVAGALRRGLLPALAEQDLSHDGVWDTGARDVAEAVHGGTGDGRRVRHSPGQGHRPRCNGHGLVRVDL
jgi:hypothetical protein